MYEPSFFEMAVGVGGLALWSRWLERRARTPAFHRAVPWVCGSILFIAVGIGVMAVLGANGDGSLAAVLVKPARRLTLAAVAAGALALGVATAMSRARDRSVSEPSE